MIARKLKEENGLAVTAQQVVVTAGAKQAIHEALFALVDAGDGVLIPTPAWPSYGADGAPARRAGWCPSRSARPTAGSSRSTG